MSTVVSEGEGVSRVTTYQTSSPWGWTSYHSGAARRGGDVVLGSRPRTRPSRRTWARRSWWRSATTAASSAAAVGELHADSVLGVLHHVARPAGLAAVRGREASRRGGESGESELVAARALALQGVAVGGSPGGSPGLPARLPARDWAMDWATVASSRVESRGAWPGLASSAALQPFAAARWRQAVARPAAPGSALLTPPQPVSLGASPWRPCPGDASPRKIRIQCRVAFGWCRQVKKKKSAQH